MAIKMGFNKIRTSLSDLDAKLETKCHISYWLQC